MRDAILDAVLGYIIGIAIIALVAILIDARRRRRFFGR